MLNCVIKITVSSMISTPFNLSWWLPAYRKTVTTVIPPKTLKKKNYICPHKHTPRTHLSSINTHTQACLLLRLARHSISCLIKCVNAFMQRSLLSETGAKLTEQEAKTYQWNSVMLVFLHHLGKNPPKDSHSNFQPMPCLTTGSHDTERKRKVYSRMYWHARI